MNRKRAGVWEAEERDLGRRWSVLSTLVKGLRRWKLVLFERTIRNSSVGQSTKNTRKITSGVINVTAVV